MLPRKLVVAISRKHYSFQSTIGGEQTRALLTSAAYVHLKHAEVSKYIRNLAAASRTILLSDLHVGFLNLYFIGVYGLCIPM